MVLPI